MHKFLTLNIVIGSMFLLFSITSIAFEEKNIHEKNNIVYELKTMLDDYVLSYCSTYDSYTVELFGFGRLDLSNELGITNKISYSSSTSPGLFDITGAVIAISIFSSFPPKI